MNNDSLAFSEAQDVPRLFNPDEGKEEILSREAVRAILDRNPILGLTDNARVSWRMRSDVKRVLLYRFEHDILNVSRVYRTHTITAVLLALLHGQRYRDAVARAAQLFERPPADIEERYTTQLAKWIGFGVFEEKPSGAPVTPLDPADYVLPAKDHDLGRWWMYRPLDLILKLTDACQRSCRYCSVELRRDQKNLPTETWLKIMDDAIDSGVVTVQLLGGDPLMHHGLTDLIHHACSRGLRPFISTKAFVSPKTAEALRGAGLDRIQISLDSDVACVEDYLVDSRGATKQLLTSIENCINAGLSVRTNSVITPYNVLLFPDLVKRLAAMGVTRMGTSSCAYSLFADGSEDLLVREAEGRWLEEEVKELRRQGYDTSFSYPAQSDRRATWSSRSFCTAGVWAVIVNSDGSVFLCDDLPVDPTFVVGNVIDTPLLDVWNSEAANRFRVPERKLFEGTPCFDCEELAHCSHFPRICFRDAFKAYGWTFGPPPYCPRAPEPPVRIFY